MAAAPEPLVRDEPTPARSQRRPRPDTLIAASLAAAALLAVAAPALFLDRNALAATFYDDAYYYFQVARNVAAGAGCTFDGIHRTNGFHPLWMFTLAPIFRLLPGELAPLRAVLAVQGALVAVAMVLVYRLLCGRIGRTPAACAALLLLAQPIAARLLRGGMESALVLALLALVWARWAAVADQPLAPLRTWWALGACCALAFLSRLEAVLAVPVILVLERRSIARVPRRALALCGPVAAAMLIYAAWSLTAFGTWGPVSGLVKTEMGGSAWAAQTWTQRLGLVLYLPWAGDWLARRVSGWLGLGAAAAPLLSTALLLAVVALALRYRRALATAVRGSGTSFALLTPVVMLLADKLSVWLMFDWYRAPMLLFTAAVGGLLLAPHPRLSRVAAAVLAVIAVTRLPQALWLGAHHWRPAGLQAADWLRAQRAPGERAGSWNAGLIGYFAGGGVVNLDGLANDKAFLQEVVRGKALPQYLRRERITWLADTTFGDTGLAPLLRRFPPAVRQEVETAYAPVATFVGSWPPGPAGCRLVAVWRARQMPGSPR